MKPYYQDARVTIYHADAREIIPTIASNSLDALWMDPPFGHSNHDGDLNSRLNEHRLIDNKPIANDSMVQMRDLLNFILIEAARILKPDCCCCCCGGGGPRPTFAWVANRMDEQGLEFFHSVIWDKINPGLGWRFRRQHEMVMVAKRSGGKLLWGKEDRAIPNVFTCSPPRNRVHPNEKPEELVGYFLGAMMTPGQTVIDPCMGSGTTLRVAKDLGINAIGIELEESHCETAAKRMAQETLGFAP